MEEKKTKPNYDAKSLNQENGTFSKKWSSIIIIVIVVVVVVVKKKLYQLYTQGSWGDKKQKE